MVVIVVSSSTNTTGRCRVWYGMVNCIVIAVSSTVGEPVSRMGMGDSDGREVTRFKGDGRGLEEEKGE